MIPAEQISEIKKQLIQNIETTFPQDKKQPAIQQIQAMNNEQLEQFLIKNNLIKTSETQTPQPGNPETPTPQCIFCSIISGQTPSTKIDENKVAIATLEINPISKGHTIIIPKEHVGSSPELKSQVFTLAKRIAKKIKSKLKPREVTISSANLFGHEIINILPVYENETINSEKHPATPEELEELQKLLEKKPKKQRIKKIKTKKLKPGKKLWLPQRIP